MRNMLKLLSLLALPAFGCDKIDDLIGTDGGTSACPAGTTLYKLESGSYTISNFQLVQDTCGAGPMLNGEVRAVENARGTVTVRGATGNPNALGAGDVRCNSGTLTGQFNNLDPQTSCGYKADRRNTVTITADNKFNFTFVENRTDATRQCNIPNMGTSCTVSWTGTFTRTGN